jgi:hypothetical protein
MDERRQSNQRLCDAHRPFVWEPEDRRVRMDAQLLSGLRAVVSLYTGPEPGEVAEWLKALAC